MKSIMISARHFAFHKHIKWSLQLKILMLTLCIFLISTASAVFLAREYAKHAARETMQAMNLGMAHYILSHQSSPLIKDTGLVDHDQMRLLMMHIMAINPAVEVYLLDHHGRVLGHVLEGVDSDFAIGQKVDLSLVQSLLNDSSPKLPVLGIDPRRIEEKNIVSIAPFNSATTNQLLGYLYIVLDGRQKQIVSASIEDSAAFRSYLIGMGSSSLLVVLFLVFTLKAITRPLRILTQKVNRLHNVEAQSSDTQKFDSPPLTSNIRETELRLGGDEIVILKRAIDEMQNRINQQFASISDNARLRRELVSSISHDLRTPLACVQGYVETALLQLLAHGPHENTHHLQTALRHLNVIDRRVKDLFELSKLESNQIQINPEVFCLAELMQDVVLSYQILARENDVTLEMSAQTQVLIRADISLIERVLQNLIENALRYTERGGTVIVSLRLTDLHAEVCISDTGVGISAEYLPYVFDRYWRAPDNTDLRGSGLGLAIVKRILDLHGIAIKVESEVARGTQFQFQFLSYSGAN